MIPYARPQKGRSLFEKAQRPSGISFSKRFDNEKIRRIRPSLAKLADIFEEVTGASPSLPRRIYTMSQAELRRSEKIRPSAEHGCYDRVTDTIKVNPSMRAESILLNIVRELIHADLPWLEEQKVGRLTDKIMDDMRRMGRKVGKVNEPTPLGIDATRLVRGLWIGSKPEIGRAVAESGFDLLVLCAEEYQPPAWEFLGVDVIHAPFDDNDIGPRPNEKQIAQRAARQVAAALRKGSNVLVTCYAGRNRSGLVCGLALVENGHDPVRALQLIWGRREHALSNQWFVDLIAGA